MRHPSEHALALHAGHDLSWMEALSINWHLRNCERCSSDWNALKAGIEAAKAEASELPEFINWERLSAHMQGNINVGVEASRAISTLSTRDW